MNEVGKIALLEEENARLRKDNELMNLTVTQMKITLSRLIDRYVVGSKEEKVLL